LQDMGGGYAAYRLSKVSLNALTRIVAAELQGQDILINSMCPGWVRTDMGGAGASRSIPEGADTAVWLATLPTGGPSGLFFRDRQPISW
jgi:NAD(P)-dependent dehydrogenase (short-subunit alcohol dehydrogenase family)